MKLAPLALSIATLAATAAAPASAATKRFALIVAAHDGGEGLPKLRYAGRDADRMRDVLVQLGGFERVSMIEIVDGEAATVLLAMDDLERRVAEARAAGDDAVLLFYYSGHAANGALRMGATHLDMAALKHKLESSSADVRLAFIDSCGAGQMTREKGGSLAPPFVVAVDEALAARGQVVITSSSADEASQESDDIQGSFFTHYLATGLRGDADRNGDGKVVLDEAYGYAYGRTVAATAMTRSGAQHPMYEYDLRGAGDVVLTEPAGSEVVVTLPADLAPGRYFIVDLERQLFVAEVEKGGGASRLALPRGTYAIKKRETDHLLIGRIAAREKGAYVLDARAMERVAFADDYAKGTPIVEQTIDPDADIGWSLSVGLGGQYMLDDPAKGVLFPAVPFVSFEGRLHNLLRRNVLTSVDVGFGTIPSERVVVVGPAETIRFPIQYTQIQAGTSIMYERAFGPLLLAGGGRMAGLLAHARFTGDTSPVDDQFYFTFSPGLVGLVGWSFTDWMHAELMARAHYVPYNVDEFRSLGAFEGLASVWVDL